jgi:hypothetical protein
MGELRAWFAQSIAPELIMRPDAAAFGCSRRALCHEHHRSKRRCGTVREMKEGPSGSAIRSLIPSHRKLLWSKVTVVSVAETPADRRRETDRAARASITVGKVETAGVFAPGLGAACRPIGDNRVTLGDGRGVVVGGIELGTVHSAVQHGVGSNSMGGGGRDSLTRDRPQVVDPDAELSTQGRRHWPIRRSALST